MVITLAETKDEMFFVHDARRRDGLDFARKEKRLRISISERLQHFVPAQKFDIDLSERELMIQSQAGLQCFFGKQLARATMAASRAGSNSPLILSVAATKISVSTCWRSRFC